MTILVICITQVGCKMLIDSWSLVQESLGVILGYLGVVVWFSR